MKLIEDFEKAKAALYEHVGFVEDWVVYAIEDCTDMYWQITTDDRVRMSEEKEILLGEDCGECYIWEIYPQRFYQKHIFRGEKLTMILVDTRVDGNKFFAFFDNQKELKC
jgi:hypothetical protein